MDVDKYSGSREDNEKEKANTRSGKDATVSNATARDAMVGIAADCNNVLAFFQEVSIKAPQVLTELLLLQANKRANRWFCQ